MYLSKKSKKRNIKNYMNFNNILQIFMFKKYELKGHEQV